MKIAALIESANSVLNSRSEREKFMITLMIGAVVLSLDYLALIGPLVKLCMKNAPVAQAAKQELRRLEEDRKNKKIIGDRWNQHKTLLDEKERMFIAPNEVPGLLENLSRSAQDSGLRIMSLEPLESGTEAVGPYSRLPIRISAVAGTHEVGKFLAALEGGTKFFKVKNLKISANTVNERRHIVELQIEGLRK